MNWHQACELPYYHGSDLGANPTAEETTFKLWAPTACGVVVCLYATGTDAEPGAKELGVHEMRRGDGGVWAIVLPGNLHGTYYIYRIYFPDGRVHEVVDPYARSAGANGTRGMVVDLTQAAPDGWEQDRRPDIPAHARSVWEVHVADFSADGHSGVRPEWRGKFMGFTPDDTTLDNDGEHPTCLNYLKTLGISHVQLQPIYDYATVDESRPDGGYNWGYDPQNYNVPEGSFATDPFHGEVRVKECRAMVAALHRAGLGVVMDVVYNHTYHGESNLERSGAHGFWPKRAGQVVQYVSAHDNYTLWDKLAAVGRRGDYDCPDADLLAQNRMTAGIYLTCQGLPFMQAGEEWGRTKYGDHNSYKGPLTTNRLDWTRAHRPEFAALTAFYRGMLAIRRAYPRLSGAAGEPEPFILALPGWLIGFVPENDGTATVGQLAVYYNPERTRQWASLPAGTWRKVSDGVHAGVTPFGPCFRDALELAPTSVTVLVAE